MVDGFSFLPPHCYCMKVKERGKSQAKLVGFETCFKAG